MITHQHTIRRKIREALLKSGFPYFSDKQINDIIHNKFESDSIIQLNPTIDETILDKIPFLILCEKMLFLFEDRKDIKLTAHNYIPTDVVHEIYNMKVIPEEYLEKGKVVLAKERDSMTVFSSKFVLLQSQLINIKNKHIYLTPLAHDYLINRDKLFTLIFQTFIQKFTWSTFDYFGSNDYAQAAFAYSVLMLSLSGSEEKDYIYYASKYRDAFPFMQNQFFSNETTGPEREMDSCYFIRTFTRCLNWFNLTKTREEKNNTGITKKVIKSDIFDDVFIVEKG